VYTLRSTIPASFQLLGGIFLGRRWLTKCHLILPFFSGGEPRGPTDPDPARVRYDDEDHVGYSLDGKKIKKSGKAKDRLDRFLDKVDDPNHGRTIIDPLTKQEIVLNDEEVDMIKRIQGGDYADGNFDPYEGVPARMCLPGFLSMGFPKPKTKIYITGGLLLAIHLARMSSWESEHALHPRDFVLTSPIFLGGEITLRSFATPRYEDYIDFYSYERMIHPISSAPEPKRRFVPSKWEHKRVMKMVRAIRKGWLKPKVPQL